jgi:large subunit ribosomal protein L13
MTTVTINPGTVERKWWVIDARDAVLGRLASTAATLLAGKNKKTFSPAHDHGDFVIIINADKVAMTGNKRLEMRYFNHSQYAGGWRNLSVAQVEAKRPGYPVRHAILGMLPHNPLGRAMGAKLHVYAGDKHPHAAQKPEVFALRKAS